MRSPKIEVLNISPDTLLFMLDDTGHETLAGNHTVYGLGLLPRYRRHAFRLEKRPIFFGCPLPASRL